MTNERAQTRNKRDAKGAKGHPKFCDGVGCYIQEELENVMGEMRWMNVMHCKSIDKIIGKSLRSIFK